MALENGNIETHRGTWKWKTACGGGRSREAVTDRGLAAKVASLSLIPESYMWKEGINFCRVSFDLHMYTYT